MKKRELFIASVAAAIGASIGLLAGTGLAIKEIDDYEMKLEGWNRKDLLEKAARKTPFYGVRVREVKSGSMEEMHQDE